ncbi:ACP S-malonyltransferase [Alloalcanivorax gelatiniphagus]|uniref:ACP S-malonyltransferase n=1 Tax=Alloalcanivorax gelatiniphagus TaxID=1194167 RepID=UPI003610C049
MSKTAFVFPGQGSQSLAMLADFADRTPVRQAFQEASGALELDLWELAQNGPEEALNRTENTQPLLLTAGVALWKLWEQEGGPRPALLAGDSLDEYTALTCAGVLSLGDAVRLVRTRGQLMQRAVPDGTGSMAAILGLDDDQVRQACADAADDEVVEAVNFNAPGQVVIAGQASAVERAVAACKDAGAKRALPLPVSVPSHCALMKPAAEQLADYLANTNFHAPELPVINNVDVARETDPARIREALIRQLYSPVRWVETVQALAADGVTTLYECGPGKVLSGLAKRIDRSLTAKPLETDAAFQAALGGDQV